MAKKSNEPNVWLTVIKLVIGATIIIGGTGLTLWYVSEEQERGQTSDSAGSGGVKGWGIASDSPIRSNR